MKVHLCNPNTTESMTATAAAAARAVAASGTEVVASQPQDGPESIEGYYDEAFALPGMLAQIRQHDYCDGHVIACFDDTGLDAARCIASGPVVGLCEAACYSAMMLANNFSVVTTLSRSLPALHKLVQHYGAMHRCVSIRASDIPVLELESAHGTADSLLETEIQRALQDDRAEAIVLGCAGMADFAGSLSAKYSVPVIDGVSAAVKMVEGLVSMQLTSSRANGYSRPRSKRYAGKFAEDAPLADKPAPSV